VSHAAEGIRGIDPYGGPCYSRNGVVEAGFASQKRFIGLYILRLDVLNAHRAMLDVPGVSLARIVREGPISVTARTES
jgi:hypothetical protein